MVVTPFREMLTGRAIPHRRIWTRDWLLHRWTVSLFNRVLGFFIVADLADADADLVLHALLKYLFFHSSTPYFSFRALLQTGKSYHQYLHFDKFSLESETSRW